MVQGNGLGCYQGNGNVLKKNYYPKKGSEIQVKKLVKSLFTYVIWKYEFFSDSLSLLLILYDGIVRS